MSVRHASRLLPREPPGVLSLLDTPRDRHKVVLIPGRPVIRPIPRAIMVTLGEQESSKVMMAGRS